VIGRGRGREREGAVGVSQCNDNELVHAMLWYCTDGTRPRKVCGPRHVVLPERASDTRDYCWDELEGQPSAALAHSAACVHYNACRNLILAAHEMISAPTV